MACKPAYSWLYLAIITCYCPYTLGNGPPYSHDSDKWTVRDWCQNLETVVQNSGVDAQKHDAGNDRSLLDVITVDGPRSIGSTLSVELEIHGPVEGVMMQARTVTAGVLGLPAGTWDSPGDVTCSGSPRDSALIGRTTHVTLKWTSAVNNEHIQFVALARTGKVTSSMTSEVVTLGRPAPDRPAAGAFIRVKRDTNLENITSGVLGGFNVTDSKHDVTTIENVITTEGDQSVDLMSYFNLMTIIGAYILMYTIFSFLII